MLDKTHSGCCTMLKSKHDYVEALNTISNGNTMQRAELQKTKDAVYCWKGTDYGY
jgi:hypothetical protein